MDKPTTLFTKKRIILLILVIAVSAMAYHKLKATPPEILVENANRAVTVMSVASLSENIAPLPLIGSVTSRSEANIRAESSGKLAHVYKRLGDYVAAGDIIAEFENSSEKAALTQAEGAYEGARTGRDIAAINTGSSNTSLGEAKTSALNTINSVYATLDDAVRTKTDTMYANPQTRDARLLPTIADERLTITVLSEHADVHVLLTARAARNMTLSTGSDLVVELEAVFAEASSIKQYLDDLSLALSRAIPDQNISQATISGYQTSVGLARAAVSGALTTLSLAKTALNANIAANAVAQKNFGESSGSGTAADASLKAALGNLNSAQVRLEKTIIRSPITGTINSLSVETGDFVPPFSDIAVVSNNGALEILAYATVDDARVLRVGNKATIDGDVSGVVTKIAPAVDPKTKKIEIRIGISGKQGTLVNGQSVRIAVMRNVADPKNAAKGKQLPIVIPLAAMKITSTGAVVFTVSASNTLMAHPIKEGALLGEKIEIVEGLTPDMVIVTDARGLKDGMEITLKP